MKTKKRNEPIGDVMLKLINAEKRADKIMRKRFPIGSEVNIWVYEKSDEMPPPRLRLTGTVRHYCCPIVGGLVVEFSPDDLQKIAKCFHLQRYPGMAEIDWYRVVE